MRLRLPVRNPGTPPIHLYSVALALAPAHPAKIMFRSCAFATERSATPLALRFARFSALRGGGFLICFFRFKEGGDLPVESGRGALRVGLICTCRHLAIYQRCEHGPCFYLSLCLCGARGPAREAVERLEFFGRVRSTLIVRAQRNMAGR